MREQEFSATVSLVGTLGILSALTPGIDDLWKTGADPELARNLNAGTIVYGTVAVLLIGSAYAAGYNTAGTLGLLVIAMAIFYYHYAYKTAPVKELDNIAVIE
jgi:hypothetical protein